MSNQNPGNPNIVNALESSSESDEEREISSSSDEESSIPRPPTKRPRVEGDELLSSMQKQSNFLANVVLSQKSASSTSISADAPSQNLSNFLAKPPEAKLVDPGELKTTVDEKRTIQPVCKARLEVINNLQRFGSNDWKEVRYFSVLKNFLAYPGFTDLKINEELCHFDKRGDLVAPIERALAGLSNSILVQKDILKSNLQSIVDWAFANPNDLNPQSLFDHFTSAFGSNSQMFKNYEQILQIICGKRAECIETRRDRILLDLPNKNVQMALRKIPPSSEYLIAKESLSALMHSLGGAQTGLNMPSYLIKKPTKSEHTYKEIKIVIHNILINRTDLQPEIIKVNVAMITRIRILLRKIKTNLRLMIPFVRNRINDYPKEENFSGGQLVRFLDRWKEMEAPLHVLKIISGARIPLISRPPLIRNWKLSNFKTEHSTMMSDQIQLLKKLKLLEKPTHEGHSFISRMFLVSKSSGELRPIFDLRGLHSHVQIRKFSLISHFQIPEFLQEGDWMVKIDYAQAYFHIPVAVSPQSPALDLQRGTSSDDELALRPLICTSHFCDDNELGCRNSSFARCESDCISRRFPVGFSKQSQIDCSSDRCSRFSTISGMADKDREMYSRTLSTNRVFGSSMEHYRKPNTSTRRQNHQYYSVIGQDSSQQKLYSQTTSKFARSLEFCQFRRLQRSTSLPLLTTTAKQISTKQTSREMFCSFRGYERTHLLERGCETSTSRLYKKPITNFLTTDAADSG